MKAIRRFWPHASAQMDAMRRQAELAEDRISRKCLGGVVVSVHAFIVDRGYARWMYSWKFAGVRMSEASIRLAFAQLFEQRKLTQVAYGSDCDIAECDTDAGRVAQASGVVEPVDSSS